MEAEKNTMSWACQAPRSPGTKVAQAAVMAAAMAVISRSKVPAIISMAKSTRASTSQCHSVGGQSRLSIMALSMLVPPYVSPPGVPGRRARCTSAAASVRLRTPSMAPTSEENSAGMMTVFCCGDVASLAKAST